MDSIQTATLTIAVAGLLLSILGLILQWRTARSDRAIVQVTTHGGIPGYGPPGMTRPGEPIQLVEAHNAGKRPVTIEDAGFELENGEIISLAFNGQAPLLPKRLEEGETVQAWMDLRELGASHVTRSRVRRAWVRDAGGRKHFAEGSDWDFLDDWGRRGSGGLMGSGRRG